MRILKRNTRPFHYCLYLGKARIIDEYGNKTNEKQPFYSEPVRMVANISPATGQSHAEQFGNLEDYDKVIVTDWVDCPIREDSVLFVDKEPEIENGRPLYDYIVKRVAKSINSISIAIRKVDVT